MAKTKFEKQIGTVKAYTLKLAISRDWTEADFKLGMHELRRVYEIDRKRPSIQHNLPKNELLHYLKTVSHNEISVPR